ncbi:AAA family ATPase [Variovorax sp. AFSI2.2]|uniref:AAA family ATPase n=1 Tax=Variovorax sp. AFSI2.2 TaxID=3384160 RepID=UPI003EB75954
MSIFSAGPRLDAEPIGDPRRQAVASLRGYAYQLHVSALAWIGLKTGQQLFLEVAEDYAVVAADALNGVQVKDTAESGALTINNQDALDALNSYVDLVHRNPDTKVSLRFLTTASLGRERDRADRVGDEGVLEYWRQAAAGCDIGPLRQALLKAPISEAVRRFIEAREDTQLREELLKRIHWDYKQSGLTEVAAQLESSLIEFASERLQLSPTDCAGLAQVVVAEVLEAIVKPGSRRRLVLADLLRVCEAHSKTAISTSTLARLQLAAQLPTQSTTDLRFAPLLESIEEVPLPASIAPRRQLIAKALAQLRQQGLLFLVGGSGLGKTLAARLTATEYGGRWLIVDFRDVSISEAQRRLAVVFAQIAISQADGIIFDDLNELEDPGVSHQMARVVAAIKRHDAVCIVTSYRQPSTAVADRLGQTSLEMAPVETLGFEEVRDLVQQAGGASERSAVLAFLYSGRGHPQLVRAFISIARRVGWATLESDPVPVTKDIRSDLQSEQRRLRQTLLAKFDTSTRTLLYRMTLLIGRFDRSLALQMADVAPPIALAGENLEQLIGPWIDELGANRLRISPLMDGAGEEALGTAEQKAVHHRAAQVLGQGDALDVSNAEALYVHSLKGEVDYMLLKAGLAIVRANSHKLKMIADWMPSLCGESFQRLICPRNAYVSSTLRFAQVLLLSALEDAPRRLSAWNTLCREILELRGSKAADLLEYMVLSKVLILPGLAQVFPNPVELLERHQELTRSDPRFIALESDLQEQRLSADGTSFSLPGLLFVTQAMAVPTVSRQRSLFVELGKINKASRTRYLDGPRKSPGGLRTIVNAAWLAEAKAQTLDWAAAADAFQELATLAAAWECRDLALSFHVARCVMLDEYGSQPERALEVLAEVEDLLGADPLLSRARAKIHFRNRRYADALSTIEYARSDLNKHDPLERLFVCRETAISAANVGDWIKCGTWLSAALTAASELQSESLRPMLIGLRADNALCAYKTGDHAFALSEMAEVLVLLGEIEKDTSTQAIYCHRVIHHGILWMYSQAFGGRGGIEVDGRPPHMEAGMCSNPEPPEAIRDQPRASKVTAWHLIAAIESLHLGSKKARGNLDRRLDGRVYPSLEFMTRVSFVESSIRRLESVDFALLISSWLAACARLYSHSEEMHNNSPAAPVEGDLPKVSEEQLKDRRLSEHARDAVLCFAVRAAVGGHSEALSSLRAEVGNATGEVAPLLNLMFEAKADSPDRTQAAYILSAVRDVASGRTLSHDQLFAATLRFIQALSVSNFRHAIEPQVVEWAQQRWKAALSARFAFKNPNATLPAVTAALQQEGLAAIAGTLLAAEPALNVRLPPDFRQWLRTVS